MRKADEAKKREEAERKKEEARRREAVSDTSKNSIISSTNSAFINFAGRGK